jgi:hypothetical protein
MKLSILSNGKVIAEKHKTKELWPIAIEPLKTMLVSGHGKRHTANPKNENSKPYTNISIEDIFNMAAKPQAISKDLAQWVLPSVVGGPLARNHKFQADNGKFVMLWADLDEVKGKTFQEVKKVIKKASGGHKALIYTTRGAEKDNPRCRAIIPLQLPITGLEYKLAAQVFNNRIAAAGLIPDRANEGTGQICGLPNMGNFYDYTIIDGPVLNSLVVFKDEIAALKADLEEKKRQHKAKTKINIKKSIVRTAGGGMTLLERFRQTFPLEDVLLDLGYDPIGDKWLYPNSESQSPGVFIFDDDSNKWGSYHSSMAAIGQPGENCVCTGDAFDLFVSHEHEGDKEKALKYAKEYFQKQDKNAKDDILESNEEKIQELNKSIAALRKGKFYIIDESVSPVTGRLEFSLISYNDLNNRLKNKALPNPKNPEHTISLSEAWVRSPHRREYEGIVFDPSEKVGDNYYNLWKGLALNPQEGDWNLFKDHILNVIANGKKSRAIWIVAWMARIFQDPGGERPGTAIVLRGGQGTGKGIFVKYFGRPLGEHYKQVAQAGQVTGRFNHHLKDALLVFVDEGFWAGDKQAEGVIKNMITESNIAIEQKGKDVIQVENHINLIIASNNSWVVPAGLEERRFNVLDVADSHQQDHVYFKAIIDQMENGGIEAMLYDLLKLNITGMNLREFEQTQALLEQKLESMTPVQKYWFNKLQDGTLLPEGDANRYGDPTKLGWDMVPRNLQHQDFLEFCQSLKVRPMDSSQFGSALNKLCKGIKNIQKNINGERPRVREFPSLDNCRKQFETLMKLDNYDWDA